MSINLKDYYNEKDRKGDFKQNPFLEISDIPKKGGLKAIVTSLRENTSGRGYSHLFLGIKNGKKEYTVGLKKDSVLLGQLCQQLTTNEKRWIGKTVTFVLAKGKYINLQPSK